MATKPREQDELEGALLPPPPPPPDDLIPLARVIASEGATTQAASALVASAVPVQHFEDEFNIAATTDRRQVQGAVVEQEKFFEEGGDDVPTAPFLPTYNESTEKEKMRSDSERVRIGHAAGVQLADAELEGIDRARRRIGAAQYFEHQAVKVANEAAKRRDREGLKVTEDKYYRPEELEKKSGEKDKDQDDTTYSNKKGGGYEVSEYETKEYKTKDYDTGYVYKSVYD